MNRKTRMYLGLALILGLLATKATADQTITLQPGESVTVKAAVPVPDVPPVVDPPVEPPPPPPVEPPAPPADPNEPVAYPALPAYVAPAGADLAKLPSDATLIAGAVYVTSGDITRNVVAQPGAKPVLGLKDRQCPQLPPVFAGVRVEGGGLPDTDELKTAGTKAGALVHSCDFVGSEGFGLLVTRKGQTRITQSKVIANGSGGLGGTGKDIDVLFDNGVIALNNLKYKRKNSNKFTRGKVTIRDTRFDGNAGVQVWADNYVQSLQVIRCSFVNGTTDKTGNRWTAADVRGEISGQLLIKNCSFVNDVTASLSIDEMRDGTVIEGNTFDGKAKLAIELRNNARDGYMLQNVTIRDNVFKTNDLDIVPSGNISLGKHKITVTGNAWPDGRTAEHVKVKP